MIFLVAMSYKDVFAFTQYVMGSSCPCLLFVCRTVLVQWEVMDVYVSSFGKLITHAILKLLNYDKGNILINTFRDYKMLKDKFYMK